MAGWTFGPKVWTQSTLPLVKLFTRKVLILTVKLLFMTYVKEATKAMIKTFLWHLDISAQRTNEGTPKDKCSRSYLKKYKFFKLQIQKKTENQVEMPKKFS